jgi:hypothetical protein
VDPSTISAIGDFIEIGSGGTLSLAGPLLSDVGGTLSSTADFLSVNSGGQLLSSTGQASIQLKGSAVTAGTNGQDTHFLHLSGAGSLVDLKGGFLQATDASVLTVKGDDFLEIRNGARLVSEGAGALVALQDSPLTMAAGSGCGSCPQAFLHLFGTGGGAVSTLELKGARTLLSATNSPVTTPGDLLYVHSGGQLIGTTADALVQLTNSAVTAGSNWRNTHFFHLEGTGSGPSLIDLKGGLLSATGGSLTVKGDDFLEVRDGAKLKSTGAGRLVELTNSPLTVSGPGCFGCPQAFLHLSGSSGGSRSTVELIGGTLLRAENSPLTVDGDLVLIARGLLTSTSTDPLVALIGGEHSIGGAVFNAEGTSSSDKPLQHAGPLLETSGATVSAERGLKIDPMLLEATAPLFKLLNGSKVTSSMDFVRLDDQARLTANLPGDALIRLYASELKILDGSLARLTGGSTLNVTGNFLYLGGGSILTLLNGALLDIRGGSSVTISGSLVVFGGTGNNTITFTNNFCSSGCITPIPGLPTFRVALSGASPSNVNITDPIKNLNNGNVFNPTTSNTAAIRLDGSNSTVTILGGN